MNQIDKAKLAADRAAVLRKRWQRCDLCPRDCQVSRLEGEIGYCGVGREPVVYTAFLHHGEEPGISGTGGSGTVFFSGCNLKCVYCQNHRFSHSIEENKVFIEAARGCPEKKVGEGGGAEKFQGRTITTRDLGLLMLSLQARGAENINLVTSTHFMPPVMESLSMAFQEGLRVPVVYNTSGYEKEETIDILEGIVDVYLADLRYITPSVAERYSNAPDYPEVNQRSLRRMYQQTKTRWEGELLKEGLVIRHLVLPGYADESMKALTWIKENVPQAIVSLMFQYQPYFKAGLYPEINRRVNEEEYRQVKGFLEELDLEGWCQELSAEDRLAGVHFKPSLGGWL